MFDRHVEGCSRLHDCETEYFSRGSGGGSEEHLKGELSFRNEEIPSVVWEVVS